MQLLPAVDWAIIRSWSYSEVLIKVNPVTNLAWPLSHDSVSRKLTVFCQSCVVLWCSLGRGDCRSAQPLLETALLAQRMVFCADGMCLCRHIVGQGGTRWRQMWGSHSAHTALPAISGWCYHPTNESCTVSGTVSWPPCVTALLFPPAVSLVSFLKMASTEGNCSAGYCRVTCLELICLKLGLVWNKFTSITEDCF